MLGKGQKQLKFGKVRSLTDLKKKKRARGRVCSVVERLATDLGGFRLLSCMTPLAFFA